MSFKVRVNWNKDGDFTDVGDDVTADVRASDRIALQYGRDAGGNASTTAGTGRMTLDNSTRKYSSRNTSSILYGKIKPARPVEITRTVGSSTYTLFKGHTDDTPLNPDTAAKTVSPSMVDNLGDFRGQSISTAMYRGLRTGDAINVVLDECGWDPALRDIDPGATLIPWWWEDNTDALTALDKLVQSEGFPALLTMSADGEVVFRDRFHRYTRTASSAVQSTWRGSGPIKPVMATGFAFDEAWQNIINRGTVQVDLRAAQPETVVWTYEESFMMGWGDSKFISASIPDPFINARVEGDWSRPGFDSGTFGRPEGTLFPGTVELTRTSGGSTDVVIEMDVVFGGNDRRVDQIRIIANPVPVTASVNVSASDSASTAEYGPRQFPGELPWCNQYEAQSILDRVVADRAQPLAVVTARFVVGNDATVADLLLPRDLSDRVRIKEAETLLDDDFHIEQIGHEFTGEDDHEMTFLLERVPPTTPGNLFIFDSAGDGFGQGVFG